MSPRVLRLRPIIAALASVLAVALVCYRTPGVNATVAAIILLLCVLLIGAYARRTEAILASVAATLCLDYLFIPPIGSITIGDPQGWIILVVFLFVSLFATNSAARLRRQRDELARRQSETERLHALSRAMLFSPDQDVRRAIVNKCMELFGFEEAVLFENASGEFYRSQTPGTIPDERLAHAAAQGSIDRQEASQTTVIPVALGNKSFGSLGFRGSFLPEGTMQAVGNMVAVGLAQAQAHEAATHAQAVRKGEELKSTMIDAMAHDLKTPLTSIDAAASTLLGSQGLRTEQRIDLLQVIQQEARGLKRLVGEAIHLARIDARRLKLECESVRVEELIPQAISALGARAKTHDLVLDFQKNLPAVSADRELLVQALKQVLDNAIKYSPPQSPVTISARVEETNLISISVRDRGQGLTEVERGRVFDKFYRGRQRRSAVQGTGMGLSIAKEILEAHAGSIAVESQLGEGTQFTITLHAVPDSRMLQEQLCAGLS